MNRKNDAVDCFAEGFSCSQAVLSAYADLFGLERELALRISGPFGGGMGSMGEVCGALTGAFMVLGLKHGRTRADDLEAKERARGLVQEMADRFRERNGAILCRELVGCDVSNPEERLRAKEAGVFDTVCPKLVRDAAEIVEQLLGETAC